MTLTLNEKSKQDACKYIRVVYVYEDFGFFF